MRSSLPTLPRVEPRKIEDNGWMQVARDRQGASALKQGARERAILGFFTTQLFILIYLQKFSLPLGEFQISVLIPAIFIGIAIMALKTHLELSAVRLVIYAAYFASVIISQSQIVHPYSQPSMIVTLVMPLPFVFVWRVSLEDHRKIMRRFQKLMLIPIAFVFIQLASQVILGMGTMPVLKPPLVPEALYRVGFNYDGAIRFGDPFLRPNGLFLLEPSFISCFIGMALVIELAFFRRLAWIAFFAVALIGTFAATGQLLVLIALPFLVHRQSARMIFGGVLAAALGIVAMVAMGKGITIDRLGELGSTGTSGYIRLVAPLLQLGEALQRTDVVFTGAGAGNIDHTRSSVWPVTKLMYEYGFMTTFSFMMLLVVSMWRSASTAMSISLFVVINFVGGYLQEPAVMWLLALLCCMNRIGDDPTEGRRRLRRLGAVPPPAVAPKAPAYARNAIQSGSA
jgi:hypothetical protein